MLFLIITLVIVGACLYFLNQPTVPLVSWVKWLINAIVCIAMLIYAANVLFGYHFPGTR